MEHHFSRHFSIINTRTRDPALASEPLGLCVCLGGSERGSGRLIGGMRVRGRELGKRVKLINAAGRRRRHHRAAGQNGGGEVQEEEGGAPGGGQGGKRCSHRPKRARSSTPPTTTRRRPRRKPKKIDLLFIITHSLSPPLLPLLLGTLSSLVGSSFLPTLLIMDSHWAVPLWRRVQGVVLLEAG